MPEISNLWIKIDSDGVATASRRLDDLTGAAGTADRQTKVLTSSVLKKAAAYGAAAVSVRTLLREMQASYRAYDEREQAEVSLALAIRNTGREYEMSIPGLLEYANALQDTTRNSSEAATQAMATLQTFANLNEEGLGKSLPMIADLAAGLRVDLNQAATLVGRSIGGTTNMLSRYGIELDMASDSSERLSQVTEQVQGRFGGLAEELGSAATGALPQFTNALDDARALMGRDIANAFAPALRRITEFIDEQNAARQAAIDAEEGLAAVLEGNVENHHQLTAALRGANAQLDDAHRRLAAAQTLQGEAGKTAVAHWENQVSLARAQVQQVRAVTVAEQERLRVLREEAEEARRLAREEEAGAARRAERAAEEAAIHETAAAHRLRIQQQMLQREIAGEENRIVQLTMMRDEELRQAAENHVRSGQEIEQINRYYDDAIAEHRAQTLAELQAAHERHSEALRNSVLPVLEELVTEEERLERTHQNLERAVLAGAISWDEYGQALEHISTETAQARALTENYDRAMTQLAHSLASSTLNEVSQTFGDIGRLMGEGSQNADDYRAAMGRLMVQTIRMIPQLAITAGLQVLIGSGGVDQRGWALIGGGLVGSAVAGFGEGHFSSQNEHGNAFQAGEVIPFASGGIVTGPTVFPMARGVGLMGEAGPEAIMPLTRIGGDLGVKAQVSAPAVYVTIEHHGNQAESRVEETTGSDGMKRLRVFIRDVVAEEWGRGSFDRVGGSRHGITPKGRRV